MELEHREDGTRTPSSVNHEEPPERPHDPDRVFRTVDDVADLIDRIQLDRRMLYEEVIRLRALTGQPPPEPLNNLGENHGAGSTASQATPVPSPRNFQPLNSTPNSRPDPPELHSAPPVLAPIPTRVHQQISLIKPRDVPELKLEDLRGIETVSRLEKFFATIERCTTDDDARLHLAKLKIDSPLSALIKLPQNQPLVQRWEGFKTYLSSEFRTKLDFHATWREVIDSPYAWRDDPQQFIHEMKCKFALVQAHFPNEELPDVEKMLKRKILAGFPKYHQTHLGPFAGGDVRMDMFLTQVIHTRSSALLDLKNAPPSGVEPMMAPVRNVNPAPSAAPRRLPPRNRMHCSYCKVDTHRLVECPHKPPYNHCFACHRPGCRPHHSMCPGRTPARNSPSYHRSNSAPVPRNAPLPPPSASQQLPAPSSRVHELQDHQA